MINHGTIAAYQDKDAATIRNNVVTAGGSVADFGSLNTAWKNLNRNLNLSSSFNKFAAASSNGYEFVTALSQSILASSTAPRIDTFITTSTGVGNNAVLRPILCPDGTVFCTPFQVVGTPGYYYLPNTDQFLTASGVKTTVAQANATAVLQPDGKVMCIPYSETKSMVFDPVTKTTSFNSHTYSGGSGFCGGVILPNGKIFLNPYNSTVAKIYDPVTNTTSSTTAVYTPASNSQGCVLAANGKVYSIPFQINVLRIYDYRDNSVTIGSGSYPGTTAFLGGVLLPNGKIFFHPFTSTTARIYDPETNIVTTPSASFPGANTYVNSILLLDGRVLLVPYVGTKPGFYDYRTDTYTTGSTNWHAGLTGFGSGCIMNNGKVFVIGYTYNKNVIFTPHNVSAPATLVLSTYLNKG